MSNKMKACLSNIAGCLLMFSTLELSINSFKDWLLLISALVMFNATGCYMVEK